MATATGAEEDLIADRYRVRAVLGRGGMSVVKLADDTLLGRAVAIKSFPAGLADVDDLRRQQDEITVLASLNHPALVTLYDAIAHEDGAVSLVMEYVPGVDLRRELASGALEPRVTAQVGADIASALAHVHERGIVHRDIKPANVLIPQTGGNRRVVHAKLADFGIARIVDSTRLTGVGSVIGTAGYLSPEQALGRDVGTSSDVYSLGLLLLECLTGVREFPGSAVESAAARISRDPRVPDDLGPEWGALLTGMTRRDPAERLGIDHAARVLAGLAASYVGGDTDADPDVMSLTAVLPATTEAATATMRMSAPSSDSATVPASVPMPLPGDAADLATIAQPPIGAATATLSSTTTAATTEALRPAAPAADAAPVDGADRAEVEPGPAPSRPLGGPLARRRILLIVATVLALLAAGIVVANIVRSTTATPPPEPVDYPVVEGPLGDHLTQLQDSVAP